MSVDFVQKTKTPYSRITEVHAVDRRSIVRLPQACIGVSVFRPTTQSELVLFYCFMTVPEFCTILQPNYLQFFISMHVKPEESDFGRFKWPSLFTFKGKIKRSFTTSQSFADSINVLFFLQVLLRKGSFEVQPRIPCCFTVTVPGWIAPPSKNFVVDFMVGLLPM